MFKRRSMLFLPASQDSYHDKLARGELGADAVIFDLEDSIPAARKGEARERLAARFPAASPVERCVRINGLRSPWWQEDLALVRALRPDSVMVAKSQGDDLARVDAELADLDVALVALVETVRGVLDAEVLLASSERITALAFGAEDFSADLGVQREEYADNPVFLQVITDLILRSRARDVDYIDAAWPFLSTDRSHRGLFNEAHLVKKMGAHGKLVVHPDHVATVNQVFTPNPRELERARDILRALEREEASRGLSVARIGDRMVDTPERLRLERMLRRFSRFAD